MANKIKDILMLIGVLLVLIIFGTFIISSIYETVKETPVECSEYGNVRFVWIGSLLGAQKQITEGEHYDGYMEVCIKGKTMFGKEWKRSNYDALVSGDEQ